jgi:anti-anti-sigma regulatory factor
VIEVCHETTCVERSAALIRCGESEGAAVVVRSVDLALRLGQRWLVVDLGDRNAVDADLFAVLHRSGQRARAAGGRLAVVCADSRMRRLFDVTLLSQSTPVFETREEALSA